MRSNSAHDEVHLIQYYVIKLVSVLMQVGGFFQYTPVFSINKTDRHDIAEILLKLVGIVEGMESVVPGQYQDRHELVEDHAITPISCGER